MADLLPVHKTGTGANLVYFRTSDVYGTTGGLGTRVGITKVVDADLTGKERILPIKELLRTADLLRIAIRYKNTAGKRQSAKILVSQPSLVKIFGDIATDKLENQPYKIGEKPAKGTIVSIGLIRRATTY